MTAAWTSSAQHSGSIVLPSIESVYFPVIAGSLVLLNAATFIHHAANALLFNMVANGISLGLIGLSLYVVLRKTGGVERRFLLFAGVALALSLLRTLESASLVEALKYLSIYLFYCAGRSCPAPQRAAENCCLYVLALLPVLFLPAAESKVYAEGGFAYLPNTNTAALYFSAVLFALARPLGNAVIVLQFVNVALMNKVGVAMATAVAIGLWIILSRRKQSIVAIGLLLAGAGIAYAAGAFDRVKAALDNMELIFSLEPSTIARMSYKDLVTLAGTTDLSVFFRVIHWTNIWDLYVGTDLPTVLFGYGAGQTVVLTDAGLAPHNDYLRVLAEFGPLSLIVFVAFLFAVVAALRVPAARVLFIVLMIYFFSENLLDNFTSMALFFAYAGRLGARKPPAGERPRFRAEMARTHFASWRKRLSRSRPAGRPCGWGP